MDLANYAKTFRRDGKVVIEIPEDRIIEAASELLYRRAVITDRQRLIAHVVAHLTSCTHTSSGAVESALHQLIGETLAEAAHAGAGLEWDVPEVHTLLHE